MKKFMIVWTRFLLWIGAAAMLLSTGCAKRKVTEESTMQLDMAQMLETAAQPTDDVIAPEGTGAANEQMRQRLGAPTHVRDSFQSKNGKQTVQIDADVSIPNATKLSIVEVSRSPLTQDRADRVVKALVKGQLLAYQPTLDICMGRQEIQREIDALDTLVSEKGASKDHAWRTDMQSQREYWVQVLDTATDTSTPIGSRLTRPIRIQREDAYVMADDASVCLSGVAASEAGYETLYISEDGIGSCLMTYVREPNKFVSPGAQIGSYKSIAELELTERAGGENPFGDIRQADIAAIPTIETTQEDAIAMGNQLIADLAIDDAVCVGADKCWGGSYDPNASGPRGISLAAYGVSNPFRCVWRLQYTRCVNGMETTYASNDCQPYIDSDDDKGVLPACGYESITVYIDDTGIVGFRWASPCEIGNVTVEDANVLPFDEIMQVFRNTFITASELSEYGDRSVISVEIDEIRFGYTRIREVDVYDKGLLIPAWDFFGVFAYESDGVRNQPQRSWFTINAIDGTIIDRTQGY